VIKDKGFKKLVDKVVDGCELCQSTGLQLTMISKKPLEHFIRIMVIPSSTEGQDSFLIIVDR
jgi:hypothetical protein